MAATGKNIANSVKPARPDWLSIVEQKVETLRYGVVQIIVHDSKVVQIDQTEKTRLDSSHSY